MREQWRKLQHVWYQLQDRMKGKQWMRSYLLWQRRRLTFWSIVEASVANERGGLWFGKPVDCVARAITDVSAISGRAIKREGSGWARTWIRNLETKGISITRCHSHLPQPLCQGKNSTGKTRFWKPNKTLYYYNLHYYNIPYVNGRPLDGLCITSLIKWKA